MNISSLVQPKANPNIPRISPGDLVKVHVKVVEGEKERIQMFQGTVISVQDGATGNFTVRRIAYGTGVERTFPIHSPLVDKVEVLRHGKIRRAKLYYLRGLTTKKSRLKEKRELIKPEEGTEEAPEVTAETAAQPTAEAAPEAPAAEAKPEAAPEAAQPQPPQA